MRIGILLAISYSLSDFRLKSVWRGVKQEWSICGGKDYGPRPSAEVMNHERQNSRPINHEQDIDSCGTPSRCTILLLNRSIWQSRGQTRYDRSDSKGLQSPDRPAGFDDALGDGIAGEAGDVVDAQPVHEPLAMSLDGLDADAQFGGDLLVGFTFGDQLQDFRLAWSEQIGSLSHGHALDERLAIMGHEP